MDWLRSASARLLVTGLFIALGWAGADAAPKVCDRCAETTTSTGTGTINLAGPVSKYKGFVAGLGGSGIETYYCIVHRTAVEWECGIGTVTDASPDTLSRDTVTSSSTGSPVSFTSGTKDAFVSPIAAYYNKTPLLTATDRLQLVDGTAAAPTYSFVSKPDFGLYLDFDWAVSVAVDGAAMTSFANSATFFLPGTSGAGHGLFLTAPPSTGRVPLINFNAGASGSDPATPSANEGTIYHDRGNKVLVHKDSDGNTSRTVRAADCTSGQFVNGLSVGGVLGCGTPAGGGGGVPVDIQSFSSNGTWTKPTDGQTMALVLACGSGGGGGGGHGAAAGVARIGGGGGGGGYCRQAYFRLSDLSATESVTAPAGGTGGTGGTSGAGGDGNGGSASSFGTRLNAPGGGGGASSASGSSGGSGAGCTGAGVSATAATGQVGGPCFAAGGPITANAHQDGHIGGGSPSATTSGGAGNGSTFGGAAGATSSTTGLANTNAGGSSTRSGAGGGAGGGVSTANPGIAQSGTDGGVSSPGAIASTGGGGTGGSTGFACGSGGNGVAGANGTADSGGAGGGGGTGVNNATGCNGGAGGIGGGGGGGGGAGTNTGGVGGNGGSGWVIVVSW